MAEFLTNEVAKGFLYESFGYFTLWLTSLLPISSQNSNSSSSSDLPEGLTLLRRRRREAAMRAARAAPLEAEGLHVVYRRAAPELDHDYGE